MLKNWVETSCIFSKLRKIADVKEVTVIRDYTVRLPNSVTGHPSYKDFESVRIVRIDDKRCNNPGRFGRR